MTRNVSAPATKNNRTWLWVVIGTLGVTVVVNVVLVYSALNDKGGGLSLVPGYESDSALDTKHRTSQE